MKVTSFRNHKLLLYHWLQWRCLHEKGVLQEKCPRKGHIFRGENNRSCNTVNLQDETPHVDDSMQPHKCKEVPNTMKSLPLVPSHSGTLPMKDTLLVMDLIELPVVEDKNSCSRYHKGIAASFLAWQRVARQRRKARCTRERSVQKWRLAVCFNDKNNLAQRWEVWKWLCLRRMAEADLWYHDLLLQKCICMWSNYCSLLTELCKAGEKFYGKRLCLSIFSEWKEYTLSLRVLSNKLCRGRAFCAWKRILILHKHGSQVMDDKVKSRSRKLLSLWRSRLITARQQNAVFSQCQKIHQIHITSSCFQGMDPPQAFSSTSNFLWNFMAEKNSFDRDLPCVAIMVAVQACIEKIFSCDFLFTKIQDSIQGNQCMEGVHKSEKVCARSYGQSFAAACCTTLQKVVR